MVYDYIIVGQGLAGSILALTLKKYNKTFFITDQGKRHTSSRVAAGIFNPITGQKLIRTWHLQELFPYLHTFYLEAEEMLDSRFFFPKGIYRPFSSIEEQNFGEGRSASPEVAPYIQTNADHSFYNRFVHNENGGFSTNSSGYLDTNFFLDAAKDYFINRGIYNCGYFDYNDISFTDDYVQWEGIKARKIIFCEGYKAIENPFFNWLPFQPVKGEILIIRIENFPDSIINKGVYIVPIGNKFYKVGATYDWRNLNEDLTENGRSELENKLKDALKVPYEIVGHEAGIRPATKGRRPFIGLHPANTKVAIFNGLGTKGVSIAPYFALQLFLLLETGKELEKEADIARFFSLYYQISNKN